MIILRRLLVAALALSCLGLGVYAYNEHGARLAAEELARSLETKNAALRKTKAAQPARLTPVAAETVAFPAGVTTPAEGPEGPGEGRPRGGPGGFMRAPGDFMALMDNPEVQQLMNMRSRGALDGRYAALFKNLHLSPDQLQKFQDLLMDKQSTMRDVIAAMRSQGLTPGRDTADQMRTLVQNANAEIDSQIQTTLGPAAYAEYQTYEQTQPQRATVDRVQQRLSYSSQPLTDEQATQLVNLMAQESKTAAAGNGNGGRGRANGNWSGINVTAAISDQTIQQASSILSAPQLATLQEMQQEQQAQIQLARKARENFTSARPVTPAPAPSSAGRQ